MKKSDLYDIALKIFGFYLLFQTAVQFVSVLITYVPYMFKDMDMYGTPSFWEISFPYLFTFAINAFFAWLLLKRSHKLVSYVFRNQKDPEVNTNFDRTSVIQIACMVIGGLTALNALYDAGNQVINIWQAVSKDFEPQDGDIPTLIWKLILIIIGYALITASGDIARRFSAVSIKKPVPAATTPKKYFVLRKVKRRQIRKPA
jgi:hypothetical protein